MTARRSLKSKKTRAVDTRDHALVVFDGADRAGSLVERGGKFTAFDPDGRHLGVFPDLRSAARAIPRAAS
jgi:hypothetical protein